MGIHMNTNGSKTFSVPDADRMYFDLARNASYEASTAEQVKEMTQNANLKASDQIVVVQRQKLEELRMMTPSFSDVAHAIGAKELAVKLEELGVLVEEHQEMAKADPLARDVRADFQRAKKAAVTMERAIDRVWNRLWWLSFDELDKLSTARKVMRDAAELTDKASARIPCCGRARRTAGPKPRELSALIVIEARTLVQGKPPNAHDVRVQEICDTYWRACGLGAIGKRGDPENWGQTMEADLKDNSALRQLIRDQLQRKMVQNQSERRSHP
jgi:hypothetical protein